MKDACEEIFAEASAKLESWRMAHQPLQEEKMKYGSVVRVRWLQSKFSRDLRGQSAVIL
jgi:hypothetical protein